MRNGWCNRFCHWFTAPLSSLNQVVMLALWIKIKWWQNLFWWL